ncbi:MAG TPA: histidine phosphatase family protein [Pyrinomonadaceae bacterium]
MKKLLILRHAKSSWDDAGLPDFDRPLNERGERDAPFMGRILADRGFNPELIVSSPAARAKRTAELVGQTAGWEAPLTFDERIYEASPQALFTIIIGLGDEISTCLLAGHNPGMEGIVKLLTTRTLAMPTASVAVLEVDVDRWSAIEPGKGRLIEVLRPKELSRDASRT